MSEGVDVILKLSVPVPASAPEEVAVVSKLDVPVVGLTPVEAVALFVVSVAVAEVIEVVVLPTCTTWFAFSAKMMLK